MSHEVENMMAVDAPYWMYVNGIRIDGRPFSLKGRRYQHDIMRDRTEDGKFKHNEVIRKGSQIGVTISKVGEAAHGAIYGHYQQGIIFYFPSKTAVEMFSASRFKPFVEDNRDVLKKYMSYGKTDRIDIKKIGKTNIYFFGGGATSRVAGHKKDAMAVRSTPADWVLLDERDLFDDEMSKQINQRLGNSLVRRRTDMGTPTIPDYGVDTLYKRSDMRKWQIRCESCGKHTCAEENFPQCITHDDYGYYIQCSHCKARLDTNSGSWQPDYPQKDTVGYWCSQLLNPNTDLYHILKVYASPEDYEYTEGEFQRTVMGKPHIDAEDELTISDVLSCCSRDYMAIDSKGPCAMGVDIGAVHYAVIGHRLSKNRYRIIKIAHVNNWVELHNLAVRYNVKSEVDDAQPEYHKVREHQKQERHAVYICYYNEHQKQDVLWADDNIVKVNRTGIFDESHSVVKSDSSLILPHECDEIRLFADQLTKTVRVQETDQRTGSPIYRYRRRGDKEDHYRNALNYFLLACRKIGIPQSVATFNRRPMRQDTTYKLGVR